MDSTQYTFVYTWIKSKPVWCDRFDVTKPWNYKQEEEKNRKKDEIFERKAKFLKSEWKRKHKDRKQRRSKTADGKRQDEEGGEMGVWVVLSGGQGDGGGRICLC